MRPSSQTTMLATLSVPWMWEMSKHSMRAGGAGRFSASSSACWMAFDEGFSTRNRASKLCLALVSTRSSMAFFCPRSGRRSRQVQRVFKRLLDGLRRGLQHAEPRVEAVFGVGIHQVEHGFLLPALRRVDRKSTRLNSSHLGISYAV